MTNRTAPKAPPGSSVNMPVIKSSPPKPRKTNENIDDPKRIIKTIAVISVVVSTASVKFFRFKLFYVDGDRRTA